MKTNQTLEDLLREATAELEAAQADLQLAKADNGDDEPITNAVREDDADDESPEEDDDTDEDEEESVFSKAVQTAGDADTTGGFTDAGPILIALQQEIRGLRHEVRDLREQTTSIAKAQVATIRGTNALVKAQVTAMDQPARPKALTVPTKVTAQPTTISSDEIFAKAIAAVDRKELTAGEVSRFQQLHDSFGLEQALNIEPRFQQFAQ